MRMSAAIRSRSNGKVCSRCSTKHRFALHSIRVLNQYEPRNHSRFPFAHVTSARAECLTLMPGLLVPRRRRAPGRHLGFTDVTLGGPFATPRARITVSCIWTSFPHSNRSGWRMVLGAVSGIETSSLRSSSGKDSSPVFTERTLALVPHAKYPHCSTRAR